MRKIAFPLDLSANFLVNCPQLNGEPGVARRPSAANQMASKYIVKISDMEFASQGVTPAHLLTFDTPNWTAPEVLAGSMPVSPGSDVFGVGSVLFEIANRRIPFERMAGKIIAQQVIEGKRPEFTQYDVDAARELSPNEARAVAGEVQSRSMFKALVNRAWSQDLVDRPSGAELASECAALRADYWKQLGELQQTQLLDSAKFAMANKRGFRASFSGGTSLAADLNLDSSVHVIKGIDMHAI